MDSIFNSPDVYKPTQTDGLETPFFEDARGSIQRITSGGSKINLLFTRAGYMRSGDLHKNTQLDFIFSGRVEVWRRVGERDEKTIYGPNEYLTLAPGVPHLFNFLEDTVMAEWWDGPFEAWYYRPYREIIEGKIKS